uniref:Matrin-type domain-containing protein n=1 Tax=Kalmanozyma brasiliensis (strain GHG001) TaxID=1365824 RepID=V5EZS4_KALBG
MGKHYCDYCDVFLTHDSVSVRKAHNSGRNHLQNVREYYQTLEPEQIQQVLDTLAHEYDRRGIEKPRDLLQPAGSSFMTFGAGPLSGASDRATVDMMARPGIKDRLRITTVHRLKADLTLDRLPT